jgi:uncharacterized membrane protein HdeD (DUF308 family)
MARGVLGIIFGILVFLFPAAALVPVGIVFAVYVAIDGMMALSAAWSTRHQRGWGFLTFEGVLGLLAGSIAVIYPGIAVLSLALLMGIWALASGLIEIGGAYTHRERLSHPVLLGIAGLASVAFGLIVMFWPIAGAMTLIFMLGVYSLVFGAVLTTWGYRLRQRYHIEHREIHVT